MRRLTFWVDSPYVARFIGCGRQDDFNYLVMELFGKSISDLRRKRPDHTFSVATTSLLAHQMLDAIESVHEHGYLHRDIKPVSPILGDAMVVGFPRLRP